MAANMATSQIPLSTQDIFSKGDLETIYGRAKFQAYRQEMSLHLKMEIFEVVVV